LADLRNRRQQQELEIANIENYALRQRFQDILDNLLTEQLEKEQEVRHSCCIVSLQHSELVFVCNPDQISKLLAFLFL
jgi:hypothetical protein